MFNCGFLGGPDSLKTSLIVNKQLRILELDFCDVIFKENFASQISFKLTELTICCGDLHKLLIRKNFNKFLASQKDTLEVLKLEGWINDGVMKIVSSMPRLKKLEIET